MKLTLQPKRDLNPMEVGMLSIQVGGITEGGMKEGDTIIVEDANERVVAKNRKAIEALFTIVSEE